MYQKTNTASPTIQENQGRINQTDQSDLSFSSSEETTEQNKNPYNLRL